MVEVIVIRGALSTNRTNISAFSKSRAKQLAREHRRKTGLLTGVGRHDGKFYVFTRGPTANESRRQEFQQLQRERARRSGESLRKAGRRFSKVGGRIADIAEDSPTPRRKASTTTRRSTKKTTTRRGQRKSGGPRRGDDFDDFPLL